MADPSQERHEEDVAKKLGHKKMRNKKGENGACLNRHVADMVCDGEKNSCSYRWQAYLQMQNDSGLYNWPAYKSLTRRRKKALDVDWPVDWLKQTLPKPEGSDEEGGSWDIKGDNFRKKCYDPYWHEAHHIIPNSGLRNVIVDFCKPAPDPGGLTNTIRAGLLKERYNLNFNNNMIMLPMDIPVANALGLPRHRQRGFDFHSTYTKHVKTELMKIFNALAKELLVHKKRKYNNLKDRIETLSKGLYKQIIATNGSRLDEMAKDEFEKAAMGPPTAIP